MDAGREGGGKGGVGTKGDDRGDDQKHEDLAEVAKEFAKDKEVEFGDVHFGEGEEESRGGCKEWV